ncbi:MAG: oxygen-independent coproporphyrinogen III oxidase [Planctomycetota bacterium]|nr:MAG: oxygen-independent coproporphyrinogen III oxidase [Planctomycetota bacterium]
MKSYADIDRAALQRYDQPGPRYTSYPTAPVWTDSFGSKDWSQALHRADADHEAPLSCYVHLPFCHSLCLYCGCSVHITKQMPLVRSYVDLLLVEAELLAEQMPERRSVWQHHWGGGTPTYLPPDEIRRLYLGIQEIFPSREDAEVSIEVDPRVTTFEQLATLRELGFNRISFGVQDFDPKVQETVHRVQSSEMTYALLSEARRLGFTSSNVDLIYGLPFQHPESFAKTLDTIIEWDIDRVACYSFAYVPWLKTQQKALPTEHLPSPETKFDLFALALEKFGAAGYEAIGLDHFAKRDDSLAVATRSGTLHRNFMGYTTRFASERQPEDMLALGVTSIGDMGGAFAQNVKSQRKWREMVSSGTLPVERGHWRSPDDEERRRIILDLMCQFRLRFADYEGPELPPFQERFTEALQELRPMAEGGLITITDKEIQVSEPGRIFLRNICMPFDAYLAKQRANKKPMFSRTV